MRVLAVIAHDKKNSLNHHIFNQILKFYKQENIAIDVLDLYECSGIPFYIHDKQALEQNTFFQKNRQLIMAADCLVIVFPVYWYSVPGILKCWIDLITNYAWSYEGGYAAKPLHHIKTAILVSTTIYPWWYQKLWLFNALSISLKSTFAWMGIKQIIHYEITNIYHLNDKKVTQRVHNILHLLKRFTINNTDVP